MTTAAAAPTTEREHYLASFEREYQITLRVLKAYPAAQAGYKPAARSTEAIAIAWTLVLSQMVTEPIQSAPQVEAKGFPPAPGDWNSLVSAFEQAHQAATRRFASMTEDQFKSPVIMPVGPGGATASMRRADAFWMMLFDTVHHRGQLSVYLRAAGAKVPSIYGPSGDEPWN